MYIIIAFSVLIVLAVFYAYFYLNNQRDNDRLEQLSNHHNYDLKKIGLKLSSIISYTKREKVYRPKRETKRLIWSFKRYYQSADAQEMQQLTLAALLNQNRHYVKSMLTSLLSFEDKYKLLYDKNSMTPVIYKYCSTLINACSAEITEKKIKDFFATTNRPHPLSHNEITLIVPLIRLELMCILEEIMEISADILEQFKEADQFVEKLLEVPSGSSLLDDMILKEIKNSEDGFKVHVYKRLMHETNRQDELITNFKEACLKLDFDIDAATQSYFITMSEYVVLTNTIIDSMKNLGRINQIKLQKTISPLENILLLDPMDKYAQMTDKSKSVYRNRIEYLSKKLKISQVDLTASALKLARENNEHIGMYFFRDDMMDELYELYSKKPKTKESKKLSLYNIFNIGFTIFLGAVIWLLGYLLYRNNLSIILAVVLIPFLYSASDTILQKVINRYFPHRRICELEFKNGIPDSARTMVLATTLITNRAQIDEILVNLETMYYSNKDKNINFGILADFTKSEIELSQGDKDLYDYMDESVKRLNQKVNTNKFYFFVRKKVYSSNYDAYISDERKRGAIIDFNQLIIDGVSEKFMKQSLPDEVKGTKYVITLDEDTVIPPNEAFYMIGAMEHPLNQPVLDGGVVTKGHAVMQPDVRVKLKSAMHSIFTQIYSGAKGYERYSDTASGHYMKLFTRGIYCGKGIYNPKVFNESLAAKLPKEKILSHDLLEGGILNAANIAPTIQEGFPTTINAYFKRKDRWLRGDMQLLPFLPKQIKAIDNEKIESNIRPVVKLQMIDNLIKALVPVSLIVALIISIFTRSVEVFLIATLLYPILRRAVITLGCLIMNNSISKECVDGILKLGSYIMYLPKEAYVVIVAFTTSLYRMYITKKDLLKWTTAATFDIKSKGSLSEYALILMPNIVYAVILIVSSIIVNNGYLLSIPAAIIYIVSIAIAQAEDKKIVHERYTLSHQEMEHLGKILDETYYFYEDYADSDTGLICDNYQYFAHKHKAERTSPTNIGFSLIAYLIAHDRELLDLDGFYDRVEKVIGTMEKMEKWNGQLYNWYDTRTLEPLYPKYVSAVDSGNLKVMIMLIANYIKSFIDTHSRRNDFRDLYNRITSMADNMDFSELYDESKHLFYIGYNGSVDKVDTAHYDMYMSEARQLSLMELCLGNVSIEHFRNLSRGMTNEYGYNTMMSWGGSTFEYLMPTLFYPHPHGSLLYDALTSYIKIQEIYCKRMNIPVGISESGYASYDLEMTYQYKSFGIPGTGIKSDLEKEIISSPYGAALMLPFDDRLAYDALQDFIKLGATGKYGLYEAVDFTPSRVDGKHEVIQNHMAHHQGMLMAAIYNYLTDMKLIDIFTSIPEMKACEILLSEPMPTACSKKAQTISLKNKDEEVTIKLHDNTAVFDLNEEDAIGYNILSNGQYHLLIDVNGNSMSKLQNICINRPYFGVDKDKQGIYSIMKVGNTIYPFMGKNSLAKKQTAKFALGYVEFQTDYDLLDLKCRMFVSAKENIEVREFTVTNTTDKDLEFEFYNFMEPVLCSKPAYVAHRTYQSLFMSNVITDSTIQFTKRKRSDKDTGFSAAWKLISDNEDDTISFYNDREKVIGRYRDYSNANIYYNDNGSSINPIDSIMCSKIVSNIEAGKKRKFYLVMSMEDTEDKCSILINMEYDDSQIDYLGKIATVDIRARARFYEIRNEHYDVIEKILPLINSNKIMTQDAKEAISKNKLDYTHLWKYALNSERAIITAVIDDIGDMIRLQELIKINKYLNSVGIKFQLAIIYSTENIYRNEVFDAICCLKSKYENLADDENLISIIRQDCINDEEDILLRSASACRLLMSMPLIDQIRVVKEKKKKKQKESKHDKVYLTPQNEVLLYNNSYGGFDTKKREYIINVDNARPIPAPWSNIITNASFGAVLNENGISFLFVENSNEKKITHWYNDSILNHPTVKLSIYDEKNGYTLVPSDMAREDNMRYTVAHGYGYSTYDIRVENIDIVNNVYISNIDDLLIQKVDIVNKCNTNCELRINLDMDAILGAKDDRYIVVKGNNRFKIVKNEFTKSFEDTYVFMGLIGDDAKFIKSVGGEYRKSECNVNTKIAIDERERKTVYALIGTCHSIKECIEIYNKYLDSEEGMQVLLDVKCAWKNLLTKIRVKTPDKATNIMMNGNLNYQTYASRLMARTGYYQCGGAFGFRDQLQDVLSLIWSAPKDVRDMIVSFAAHQFESGDVQHWWHMPRKGVRTHITDDMVFLVYLTNEYIEKTNDYSILYEESPYLIDVEIPEGQHDFYGSPDITEYKEPLIVHCVKALKRAYTKGEHNLPLMGGGDWNDGMNNVGVGGKGESVWLGFFIYYVMRKFYEILHHEKRYEDAEYIRDEIETLKVALEESSWDGHWFIRAFFDDGTPLGSDSSGECKIDVISQAWAIISGIATKEQTQSATKYVERYLFDKEYKMLKLLWPAFDKWDKDAGYIKGYIPGIRENGAQYTHGAVWMLIAYCVMGDGNRAYDLLSALNPINHARTVNDADIYKVEPYVVAADIYAALGQKGRGGWTWYTGSASWLYKAILEYVLGIKKEGEKLYVKPCIPDAWNGFEVNYLYESTRYNITVNKKSKGVSLQQTMTEDGKENFRGYVKLVDDNKEHNINVLL